METIETDPAGNIVITGEAPGMPPGDYGYLVTLPGLEVEDRFDVPIDYSPAWTFSPTGTEVAYVDPGFAPASQLPIVDERINVAARGLPHAVPREVYRAPQSNWDHSDRYESLLRGPLAWGGEYVAFQIAGHHDETGLMFLRLRDRQLFRSGLTFDDARELRFELR